MVIRQPSLRNRWLALLGLAALTTSLNCESTLELDTEYQIVAQRMCQCDQVTTALGDSAACEEIINNRIETASDEVRKAWFNLFVTQCQEGCDAYRNCLGEKPICAERDEPCGNGEFCCSGSCDMGATNLCL